MRVLDFIYATQPKEWEKLKQQHGADVKPRFLQRLASEIAKRGTLDVLRKGIKDQGCKFRLAYFRPASGLNEAVAEALRSQPVLRRPAVAITARRTKRASTWRCSSTGCRSSRRN